MNLYIHESDLSKIQQNEKLPNYEKHGIHYLVQDDEEQIEAGQQRVRQPNVVHWRLVLIVLKSE